MAGILGVSIGTLGLLLICIDLLWRHSNLCRGLMSFSSRYLPADDRTFARRHQRRVADRSDELNVADIHEGGRAGAERPAMSMRSNDRVHADAAEAFVEADPEQAMATSTVAPPCTTSAHTMVSGRARSSRAPVQLQPIPQWEEEGGWL